MMKNDRQRLREWLAEHPGEFTIMEAMEGTGVSMSRLAFLFNNKGMAERVGQRAVPYSNLHSGHYYVKLFRRVEA